MTEAAAATPVLESDVPSLELIFRPTEGLIWIVRRFVADFFHKVIGDQELSSRLALTVHELLENTTKYSIDGAAKLRIEVDLPAKTVSVRTTNRSTAEQIAALERIFGEIEAAPDADALYAKMMEKSATKKSGSGGIGLARVWAESEMAMTLQVEGDRVEIVARGQVQRTQ